ncbi:alpha/beta hydrolase family protein [Pseudalkalibacillus hwajinpoensis]|uniref:alpha/beta hydrolase family protein n=1 Tax=Guptibacillus hwajinpoensis TaxID=208199 RepID=UPI001CD49B31|nr:alpha/beta fold hydrolase [Pseudalkalibacillus hwajinpoensis]MCA0990415.1 dienelactone hydrolase family protein [Pseudalkalibacillus hwajinpoensis]
MIKMFDHNFSYYLMKPFHTSSIMTIILFHGWGSNASKYLEYASSLTRKGYTVIIPELIYHDTRNPLTNPFNQKNMETYFWNVIFQSIDECHHWLNCSNIIKQNTVVAGVSMGGFIASGVYATTVLKGLASISGSGSFFYSERLFRQASNRDPLTNKEATKLKMYDPMNHVHGDGEILLLHGEQDQIISIKAQEDYFAYLTNKGKKAQFNRYKDVEHEFTTCMQTDVLNWLEVQAAR